MSDTQTVEADTHYDDGFADKRKVAVISTWQDFQGQLKEREREIASMLPNHVSRERFTNSAIAAVKQNPDLLKATPRSLFGAITKSAQDGLLPDGREGVITVYNTKTKAGWESQAQWNPMTGGLRKRARELDDIIIDAQVVCEGDKFVWHQGDDPHIEHTPAKLGTPRGPKIGAYAIFKREDGTILHREVMDVEQIETVRKQSKAPDSLMWTKFSEEGYRKSVIRRGIKTVPVSEKLETIVRRDDDLFNFDEKEVAALAPPPAPPAAHPVIPPPSPPRPPAKEEEPEIPDSLRRAPEVDEATERRLDREAEQKGRDEMVEWLEGYITAAATLTKLIELERMDDEVCRELDTADREDLRERWNEVYMDRKGELKPKRK